MNRDISTQIFDTQQEVGSQSSRQPCPLVATGRLCLAHHCAERPLLISLNSQPSDNATQDEARSENGHDEESVVVASWIVASLEGGQYDEVYTYLSSSSQIPMVYVTTLDDETAVHGVALSAREADGDSDIKAQILTMLDDLMAGPNTASYRRERGETPTFVGGEEDDVSSVSDSSREIQNRKIQRIVEAVHEWLAQQPQADIATTISAEAPPFSTSSSGSSPVTSTITDTIDDSICIDIEPPSIAAGAGSITSDSGSVASRVMFNNSSSAVNDLGTPLLEPMEQTGLRQLHSPPRSSELNGCKNILIQTADQTYLEQRVNQLEQKVNELSENSPHFSKSMGQTRRNSICWLLWWWWWCCCCCFHRCVSNRIEEKKDGRP